MNFREKGGVNIQSGRNDFVGIWEMTTIWLSFEILQLLTSFTWWGFTRIYNPNSMSFQTLNLSQRLNSK